MRVTLDGYGALMDTTLNPKQTDPPHVLVARADEEFVHAHEQIARAGEEIARAEEQLSKLEHDAARHPSDQQTRMNTFRPAVPGNRPLFDRPAVRGFTGLLLAACIGVAAIAWQSSYGDAAIIARWAPQRVVTSSPPLENPGLAQTAPEDVAPTAAALSPELTQLLQSMARDLANLGQGMELLKASQEQMARDNANAADQLKASQEQMARVIAKASEQSLRPKISAPPPRPTAATTRKPVPTLPSPQAVAQPQAE